MNKRILCAAVLALSAVVWAAKPKPADAGFSITGAVDAYDPSGHVTSRDAGAPISTSSKGSSRSPVDPATLAPERNTNPTTVPPNQAPAPGERR